MLDPLAIQIAPCPDMNRQDLEKLAKLSINLDSVRSEFLAGRITPSDYMDFLAEHGMAMDQWVATTTANLTAVGIIQ